MRSPLILQVSLGAINYAGLESVTNIALFEAAQAAVPIAVHLDHVKDIQKNILAMRAGVGSLCMDAADLPYEENMTATKEAVQLAHAAGLEAEAGIGYVPVYDEGLSLSEHRARMTDINEAQKFVDETCVDLLAVSFGSMRSMKSREVELDIQHLRNIEKVLQIPLVLHGASGVTWNSINKAIQSGICKVNIASTFDKCFVNAIRRELAEKPEQINFRKIFDPAREEIAQEACRVFTKLGSTNKY